MLPGPRARRSVPLEDPRLTAERASRPVAWQRRRGVALAACALLLAVQFCISLIGAATAIGGKQADNVIDMQPHPREASSDHDLLQRSRPVTAASSAPAAAESPSPPARIAQPIEYPAPPHTPVVHAEASSLITSARPEPAGDEQNTAPRLPGGVCLQTQRGYWTYELCIGDEARQFHQYVKGVDRHQQKSLGKFRPEASAKDGGGGGGVDDGIGGGGGGGGDDEAAQSHDRSVSDITATDSALGVVLQVQQYVGGDVCLPSKQRRQTVARIACGVRDRLVEVREPEPCHYALDVELKAVCTSSTS